MRLILVVCVVTTILITCIFAVATANSTPPVLPVDVSKTSSNTEPWRATHPTATNGINNKRFLRREEETNQNIKVTGSTNDTSNIDSTSGPSEEERGVKVVPLEMLGKQEAVSKLVKKKTITTAVTNLLRRNKKQKILRKFRVKILESLPPEQAADLIFLKMPKKEIPPKLPSKLPNGIKGFNFKIPGVSDAIIVLKMELWYYYRAPPSFVFRKLGLFGKGSGEKLHAEDNYKYFRSYWEAWYNDQKHLIF